MAKVSLKSVRVTSIPSESDQEEFVAVAKRLAADSASTARRSRPKTKTEVDVEISFAPQQESFIGTISLPTEKHKVAALANHDTNWEFDDEFNGITVLNCPATPDLEFVHISRMHISILIICSICAVHGLNGNGFDSWVSESKSKSTMWLRDLLPTTKPFDNARIMTFGYSSRLRDTANVSGMSEWVQDLLGCMNRIRQSLEVDFSPQYLYHELKAV
jgi:hypothetical protein